MAVRSIQKMGEGVLKKRATAREKGCSCYGAGITESELRDRENEYLLLSKSVLILL